MVRVSKEIFIREQTATNGDSNERGQSPQEILVVAISSRALFNLDESHAVFKNDGVEAYCRYQVEREDIPLEAGVAFNLVKKLLETIRKGTDPHGTRLSPCPLKMVG